MPEIIRILDGEAQLYKRLGSDKWYVRFSVTGQGQIRRALKTTDQRKATTLAKRLYYDAMGRAQRGLAVDGYMFEKVANEFLQNFQRRVERGEKKAKDLQNLTGVVTRYFIPYFKSQTIDEIDEADIDDYREWRKDYWLIGPGKDVEKISYKRGGHTLFRPVKKSVPSLSRQHQELSMLRQLFKFAARKRYVDKRDVPEITSEPVKNNEGAGLTDHEFQRLLNVSYERITENKINPKTFRDRTMLDAFIRIAANTGMRPTELYGMKWGDLDGINYDAIDAVSIFQNADRKETNARSRNASERETPFTIWARGKGKHKHLVPGDRAARWIYALLEQWHSEFETVPDGDDPVFFNKDGKPIKSFKIGLASLLMAADLLYDKQNRRRTAYCFRHYYITQKILAGIDLFTIAINVGTSVKLIESTYSHITPLMYEKQLRANA